MRPPSVLRVLTAAAGVIVLAAGFGGAVLLVARAPFTHIEGALASSGLLDVALALAVLLCTVGGVMLLRHAAVRPRPAARRA